MVFVTGKDGSMFLMLSEDDIGTLRRGNTKFVDERQTQGQLFNKVVLSLHPTDEEAVALLRKAGHDVPDPVKLKKPEPQGTEGRCQGCKGIIEKGSMYEDRCIICWANIAKRAQLVLDGQNRRMT